MFYCQEYCYWLKLSLSWTSNIFKHQNRQHKGGDKGGDKIVKQINWIGSFEGIYKNSNMRKGLLQVFGQCSLNYLVKLRSVYMRNIEYRVKIYTKGIISFPFSRDHNKSRCLSKICILHKILQMKFKSISSSSSIQ